MLQFQDHLFGWVAQVLGYSV